MPLYKCENITLTKW